jgi:hypothetical protein
MPITKPLIFTNIGIGNSDGSGITYYPLHVSESATVTVTPTSDLVDAGLTLNAFYDISVEIISFNTNLYADTRVYTNTSAEPTYATMFLSGATGAETLNIGQTLISATRVYDGNRTGISLTCTKRAVSDELLVNPA